ncbi:Flp pilus assembly protein CpaB [Sphingomonas histidinilytica]|jgi:pilus assembly protein CpaB|uniref:Pilus assembly protein CpaB n=1 Tax=Rhizorhabdus histidinilytica TaxID=439228 RepID=A0A1T4ZVN6_9SPHN|nr:Flp pilus assembly protein CpaB [Rhizorhabdus histidinilytica]MBO9377523.1 Flp pilus assembly protein CpaB [Rhizorhabdus histidinilytica]QEH78582.1 Flp pilus assembly protein CpaB [Sphingomonas sp. C8-2]SKB26758.1 pilus assembly protein CpaB [Rhizorhabdus histidinilytica]
MDARKLLLLIMALVMAGISAVVARSMFGGNSEAEAAPAAATPQPSGPEVAVAVRPLPVGTIIGPESFRYQRWPAELVSKTYFIKGESDLAALNGSVVRYAITAGAPVTQGALVKPGDRGFLAAALGPGMRAVTISVSAQSGVAGFVFPGDRVDLMLTQEVPGGGDGPPLKAAETIIRNIRVLAADQRTDKTVDEEGKTVVANTSNVTLEATPKIAEKIAVAQTIGQLSLALRSIADDRAELEERIANGEIKLPAQADPKAERQMLLEIASRPIDTNTTYTVGADVSRYQRSSVPAKTGGDAAPAPAASAPAAPTGPVVRVARGNMITVSTVGAK